MPIEPTNTALLEAIQKLATKDDLKNFATKDDLKNLTTKDDFKDIETQIQDVAESIQGLATHMDGRFDEFRSEMATEFAEVREDMATGFADIRSCMVTKQQLRTSYHALSERF